MGRPALRIEVAKKDQKKLEKMLSGGVQPVRAVLRAMPPPESNGWKSLSMRRSANLPNRSARSLRPYRPCAG
jgi:hypothetical protein